MEGPSLFLAQEQLAIFKNRVVKVVSGNTSINKDRILSKELLDIFSWGKHLVFQFDDFAIRIHFLLFGTFRANVGDYSITGDYKEKTTIPRLALEFDNGSIKMYSCSVKIIESSNARGQYDFSLDIMSLHWDPDKAFQQVLNYPNEEISDILLDQTIFSGVGNIIKNEVLSLVKLNPRQKVKDITEVKIKELIAVTRTFSHQFYEWRKVFQLKAHLKIHRRTVCPYCGQKIIREKTGKRNRWAYYCSRCQSMI